MTNADTSDPKTMEAVDNPSYFSLEAGAMGAVSSTECSTTSLLPHSAPPTPTSVEQPSSRRSFRSLLRSVSAHAHNAVPQQLLVLGEPRPSDKAPTSPREDVSAHHKTNHRTASCGKPVPKSSPGLLSSDMVFWTPNTVLLGESVDNRYYNLTMPLVGRRRHSIGTFLKTPGKTASPAATAVNTPAAATKPDKPSRRHRPATTGKAKGVMADILLVSSRESSAAALWVDYVTSCFDIICRQRNRPPYKVVSLFLEDLASSNLSCGKVRLQIVVVCPALLTTVNDQPLEQLLQPDRVLAMLLGVAEESITEQQRTGLAGYPEWKCMAVKDSDELFVGSLLEEAMSILNRPCNRGESERPQFSLFPKKVKEGSSKVLILLSDPISKDDTLTLTLTRQGGEVLELGVKRRNAHTLHFTVPPACLQVSQLCSVSLYKNNQSIGVRQVKCESRMRELDQLLRSVDSPLELMCQSFGFSDRDQLDTFLVSAFQRNLPPHFNLLNTPHQPARGSSSPEDLPTLLHFSAAHGLERLSWQLLECPGGEAACEVRNASDLTPADLAERAGHEKLAGQLRGYMQMNEFTSMYSYLKVMSEGGNTTGFSQAEYQMPRPLDETYQIPRCFEESYQVPPSPRPTTPGVENYDVLPSPRPFTPTRPLSGGYMDMQSSRHITTSLDFLSPGLNFDLSPLQAVDRALRDNQASEIWNYRDRQKDAGEVQSELVEIINDFKNNVFTITEVEKLVASWKNRLDVQQDFKDKQEQLNVMRAEHERLQRQMKESMRGATPFDRIRNFFKGSKSKDTKAENKEVDVIKIDLPHNRPPSSLSLHSLSSSISSGRMSTVSACSAHSLGDSGTHSDPEERKAAMFRNNNYEVPPAPRRFHAPPSSLALHAFTAPTPQSVEDRPPCPPPRPDDVDPDSYYITPPNGNGKGLNGVDEEIAEEIEYLDMVDSGSNSVTDPPMPDYMNIEPAPPLPPRR